MENKEVNGVLAFQYQKAVSLVIKLTHIIETNNLPFTGDTLKESNQFIKENESFYRAAIEGFKQAPQQSRMNCVNIPQDDYFV